MNETEDRKSLGDRIKANLERLKGGHTLWEECNVSQKKAMGKLAEASKKFDQICEGMIQEQKKAFSESLDKSNEQIALRMSLVKYAGTYP